MADPVPHDQVDWGRLLRYLAVFERPGFKTGEWDGGEERGGVIVMPWWTPSDEVAGFLGEVFGSGAGLWGFDWMAWADDARRHIDDPATLASADLETCRRLLTLHVRQERFHEGHIAAMFEMGHMVALLRRIFVLVGADEVV